MPPHEGNRHDRRGRRDLPSGRVRAWFRFQRVTTASGLIGGALLTLAMALGCRWTGGRNESIIRVQTTQDPAKAARLTHAGIASLNKGKIDHAAKHFTAAIAADPAYGPAHNNLGLMHYEQGNLYQAVLAFEQAVDFLPQDAVAIYNLALTLESAGRTDEALMLYEEAVEMESSNPIYLGNLVRLKIRLGEQDDQLVAQLQDLVLIETRPQWRRWADTQLSLNLNEALDRGPATPDFNADDGEPRDADAVDLSDKIIDLTPQRSGVEAPVESMPNELGKPKDEAARGVPDLLLEPWPDDGESVLTPPTGSREIPRGSSPAIIQPTPLMQPQQSERNPIDADDYFRSP